jgi:hypothetical protein
MSGDSAMRHAVFMFLDTDARWSEAYAVSLQRWTKKMKFFSRKKYAEYFWKGRRARDMPISDFLQGAPAENSDGLCGKVSAGNRAE